jgi:hypothetical protein
MEESSYKYQYLISSVFQLNSNTEYHSSNADIRKKYERYIEQDENK